MNENTVYTRMRIQKLRIWLRYKTHLQDVFGFILALYISDYCYHSYIVNYHFGDGRPILGAV